VVKPSAVVPGLNPAVEQVILRCLDPEPSRRPAAAEIAASLRGDLGSANLGPGAHSQPYRRRPGRYLALIAASLVVSAAGAQLWVAGPTPAGRAVAVSNLQVQPLTLDGRAALGAISPDGRLLVYQTYEQLSINVRRLSDSADRTLVPADRFSRISSLTVGPRNEFVDVVAITGDATLPDLWRIPLHGGGGTRLVRDVVSAVGWSPDGRQMAYLRGETTTRAVTLVVADAEGCHSRDVVTRRPPRMFYGDLAAAVGRPPSRPAWSPDGRSITLAGYSEATLGNASELVTVDAATGRERHSVGLRGTWSEVAWLDERRYLLVGGDFPLGFPTKQVWITDLAGRHRAGVTREFGFFMNLSLTGDRTTAIAKRFSRFSGISVSDGSGRNTEIRVPLSIAAAAHPRIDDAGGLTYTALTPDGGSRLYHLGPNGKVPVEVVEGMPPPFTVPFHDVSADGRTIIFKQLVEPQGLFRVDRDGDQLRLVESDVAIPRLTPDGATVLFTRNTVPGLYEISVGGGPIRRVTARAIPDGRMDRRFGAGFSISPTGRRLLIQTGTPGLLALCDLPACEQWTEVALPSLHWSPGGTGVVYVDSTTIFEQLLAGGPPRVIATPDGGDRVIDFSWSRDGSRLATARGWYPNDMVSIKGLR
jgi:Tol biopolymer transport system component